ncbi:MAG: hypothetical protein WAL34_04225 [Acidobacteriaceae bacterium]
MKVLERGHIYQPQFRTPDGITEDADNKIIFVNKQKGQEHSGTTTQEVIRVLLDRTRHCANCMPHPNNERIVYHLRMALILHEARALERKTEKGDFEPEYLVTGGDGHFEVHDVGTRDLPNHTPKLIPHRHDWDRQCNHPEIES